MAHSRPDPDALLRAVTKCPEGRGRLKVFLGASAGVGKTYAMLSEAHEYLKRGLDVVIGYVETHGRSETEQLIHGLEHIPLKRIEYRGSSVSELDVPAIMARRPELVLIDELAHSNIEGSVHRKRWQDIKEILDAGIDVYTAVNVQHVESLNDVVAQVTGVRVSETVPDAFLESADDIELIDIPPVELQQRIREGKVYIPEKVEQALGGFFKPANLTALRELALRRAADAVDAEVQRLRTQAGAPSTWATRERIVVCVAPNRMASRVVRAAARLAATSHAELIAVTVESDRQASRTAEQRAAAEEALELARKLGIEVVSLNGHDIVAEIFNFAHRRNATLVVVGKPIRPRWKEILFGSVVDELVRSSGDIDVYVITAADVEQSRPQVVQESKEAQITVLGTLSAFATPLISTAVGSLLFQGFGIANVAMVYVLGVAVFAMRSSRLESVICTVLNVLSFNFFFVEPRYTFAVSDSRYLLLFMVMLIVALVISTLTHRLRAQLVGSSERERRTSSLFRLSQQLAQQRGKRELAHVAAKEIRDVFDGDVSVMLWDGKVLQEVEASASGFERSPTENAVAVWVAEHAQAAGVGTDTLPGSKALYLPLKGAELTVGVLAYQGALEGTRQRQLLETFGNALGLALERAILAKASNEARVQAESERIRSTLLSSISHDLRTPLTTITGAASSLMAGNPHPEVLGETIYEESIRLNQQIQNLLDMTRLQSGSVVLEKVWHAPQDLIANALHHTKAILGQRSVTVKVPVQLPLIKVDGVLIEKALVNLLENAGRHTSEAQAVFVEAKVVDRDLVFEVADTGPGLPHHDVDQLFTPGYRTPSGGYGLGLAVVKAALDLHGGEVRAGNRPGGGAVFSIHIPLPDRQPEAPGE